MKKLLLSACVAFAMLATTNTFAQQGFGTNIPDKSAAVDVVSSKRGMLIPRLNLVATDNQSPVTEIPAQSLLVYNQATAGAGATAVTPGFYYWDTNRWVRIVSTTSEKITKVVAGTNVQVDSSVSADGITTTYTVGVAEGTQGQVLVTVENPTTNELESKWVDASAFISGVNGITITPVTNPTTGAVTNEIGIGGTLTDTSGTEIVTDPTTGKTLAITGLEVLDTTGFDPATQNIMVMGTDGILKQVAPKTLIEDAIAADNLTAKELSSVGGIISLNGADTAIANSLLKDVELGVNNRSIGPEKLNPGAATVGQIATVVDNAGTTEVQYQNPSTAIGKTLTTDNIIGVGADNTAASNATANQLDGAVLTPTYLKIKDDAITAQQIAPDAVGASELADNSVASENIINGAVENADLAEGSVSANKMTSTVTDATGAVTATAPANTVPTANGTGGVTYQTIAAAAGEDLTTDGKIVVGDNTSNITSLENAVLVATRLSIKQGSIGNVELTDGAVTADKMQSKDAATGANVDAGMIPTADGSGGVSYETVADAAGKTLTGSGITVTAGTTVGTDTSVAKSVLADVTLGIADNAITSEKILNGTIEAEDIQAPGSTTNTGGTVNQVMVTNSNGEVAWINQSALANKDNYIFEAPLAKDAGTANANGGTDYEVSIATASATSLGVVKQSAATGEEITIAADGSLSVNESNVVLSGDVTGPLNDTNVAAIQGTAVSATAPTANQVMTFNNTTNEWTPTAPTSLVLVDNGISKATDGDIILGGTLNEAATVIKTAGASNTLAVEGLIVPTAASEVMYAEGATGVLRKAVRSIAVDVTASQTVTAIAGYNSFVQEITISATIGASEDIDITLPTPSADNKGQVVNVKIANTSEPDYYLNIRETGGTTLTYGSLPYQGWIVKSNGTAWEVVGRN
ncbi:beta strand repeat-containing protein [Paenimyroides aestuarii]|uniref:Uncharacterized protein n=1 Tax=Paenimyroides aestuarii TaxID=2968490 RepID=A0ABY5NUJ9_9FLAO|nr:hypothetical protein [Paenimyroides aestuarii]UUV22267.1 hypothetical protein NPX36_04310 [Paenimyroides aestuarii]